MNSKENHMTKRQKISIARIFSDLIKADRIIDTGEMDCWERLCEKYSIDREAMTEAQGVSFAEAVETICSAEEQGLREDLLGDCRSMTVSDGFCAHAEALVMIALSLALDPAQTFRVEAISIPKANFNIDVATALYVEGEYDREVNEAIGKDYRSIYKELQLAGFHFVYIPSIIAHYRRTDSRIIRGILSFLAPNLSEAGLDNAYRSLLKMTTDAFCKDLLCNKCGITDLRDTYPSLLVKIGTSFVEGVPYANYLRIEVGSDISETVRTFVDLFCDMLPSDVYIVKTSEERDSQFHFHGFYKQLLDIFLIPRNIRSTILINPYREEIVFPDIDAKATGLHRRERALYALMLCQGSEGLNLNPPDGADSLERYNRRMDRMQRRYAMIYGMLGGESDSAPDLRVPEIRRPIFSRLRKSLRELQGLYNPDDYNITKNRDGVFAVHVEQSLARVVEIDSDEGVPLAESEIYRRWKEL